METYIHKDDDAHDTNGLFPFISTPSNATYYRHLRKKKDKKYRKNALKILR